MKLLLSAAISVAALASGAAAQLGTTPAKTPPAKASGSKHAKPALAPAPPGGAVAAGANDDCANPKSIAGPGTYAFDSTFATTGTQGQSNAACLFFGQTGIASDVWFEWTSTFSGTARLEMCASASHDAKVAVYAGTGCPASPAIACDDDACCIACPSRVVWPVSAGATYVLQVGCYPGAAPGGGAFEISQLATPANDACSGAAPIAGPGPHGFDTTSATTGAQGQTNPLCSSFGTTGIANDVWFAWTAGFTGTAAATMCAGASHDAKLAVYAGAGCPGAAAIACDDDYCAFAGPSRAVFPCVAGQVYTIQIGNYPSASGGAGTFTVDPFFPPSNDGCASATPVAGPGPHAFDNSNATTGGQGQANASCSFFGTTAVANDVWFAWTASFSGPAQLSLCAGSSHDTKVAVYAGAGCPAGQALGCDDDFCSFAGPSRVVFGAVAGTVYTFQVGTYPGAAGAAGSFRVDPFVPAPGDECGAPIAISGDGPHAFDTTGASQGAQGQSNPNCLFFGTAAIDKDVWYAWTSACDGTVTLSLCAGASHDTKVAVYAGAGCPSATALACDDDLCFFAGPSQVAFPTTAGATYLLQIGNYFGSSGSGTFTLSCDAGAQPGTAFCKGDGLGSAVNCPCNNLGALDHGCENSAGTGGARLTASGITSPDTVVLTSSDELPTALSIFLQGTTDLTPGVLFGDGVRCVGGNLKRLYARNAVGGSVSAPIAGEPSLRQQSANLGDPIAPGSTRWYQVYYRDPALTFCPNPPGNSWNASSGYRIVWP